MYRRRMGSITYFGMSFSKRYFLSRSVVTARKHSLLRLCFYRCMSVHSGKGRAWQGACVAGGHAWLGVCVAGGHAWLGGMHGRGCAWQGACMPHTPPPHTHYEIRSVNARRYASYWNAFLFATEFYFYTR